MAKATRKPKKSSPDAPVAVAEKLFAAVQSDLTDNSDERVRLLRRSDSAPPLLIYVTPRGINVDLPWQNGTLWANQRQMADMFGVNVPAISKHLKNIFDEGELLRDATISNMETVQIEGDRVVRREPEHYNINAIISVGYRIESKAGTMFRIWATERLVQILTKGFFIDEERLKNDGGDDALSEFREIASRIRGSIRNSYREVLRLCTLCSDYDGRSETAREFFMDMENKLLWAASQRTAPQLILERCDADKPDLGLTYFAGKRGPTKKDVVIGNNYLAHGESRTKNRITEMWLTYVEEQLEQGRLPTMEAVREKLVGFIKFNQWPLLTTKGRHSRERADDHALEQLEIFRAQEG
jgi:hypothetical protein